MILKPQQLGNVSIDENELESDRKSCKKFGPCGVGKKALYLNSFYFERRYYIAISSVKRVFKRVAMSKGGFTGKGIFATIPYLVVEYDDGKQKQCNFKYEEQVDQMLGYIESRYPEIKTHSAKAEKRLAEKEKRLSEKKEVRISPKAQESIRVLETSSAYLKEKPDLYIELSNAAKKKRTYDKSNPAYKWVALFISLMGLGAVIYGVYAIVTHAGFAMYFLLFGLAAIFLFSSANVLPTAKNNRKYVENRLDSAVKNMQEYVNGYPEFPVPAQYAHPGVLKRMKDILCEGRSETIPEALGILKSDLKALNSSVSVEQEEFDEIMAIKPMFLVMDYK